MSLTLEELKEKILNHYDPDDVLSILNISSEELLESFEDKLIEYRWKFEDLEEDGEDY